MKRRLEPHRKAGRERSKRAPARLPSYRAQLATPVDAVPSGDEWLHELKYDGYRVGCFVRNGAVRLENGDGDDCTGSFPELARTAARLPAKQALIDGEIAEQTYFAFDLLHLDGRNLSRSPLEERKVELRALLAGLPANTKIRYAEHFEGDGELVLRRACELGAAGIVSKRRDRGHRPGRSSAWLATKCAQRRRGVTCAVRGVTITTPERIVYPAFGFTKLDLACFYDAVSPWMLPYLRGRPLTLVRCERGVSRPDALRRECSFLRHTEAWHRWAAPSIRRVSIREQKKIGEYLVVDSAEALVGLAQGDILEIHVWNATADRIEQPDQIVFDLDPAPDVPWSRVIDASKELRDRLRAAGLESWPRLTGGKGIHAVVPFEPELGWDDVYDYARSVAESMVRDDSGAFTTTFAKAERSQKILVDYKRNHRAATAIVSYSARAHPNGSVATPVSWKELVPSLAPAEFTVKSVLARLRKLKRDPWDGFLQHRQRLRAAGQRGG